MLVTGESDNTAAIKLVMGLTSGLAAMNRQNQDQISTPYLS